MAPGRIERPLAGEADTLIFGQDLARALRPGDRVGLAGDLGAGKTTLARAVIRALADDAGLEVPSPTFTLVQAYDETRIPVRHFDLYRLAAPEEIEELGLAEAAGATLDLVEWPERAGADWPGDALMVRLEQAGAGRRAVVTGPDEALARVARSLAIRDFLAAAGHAEATRRPLAGDASPRAYETVHGGDGIARVLMDAPARRDEPPVRSGRPYSAVARIAGSVHAFVAVDRLLRAAGFAAPRIDAADLDQGLLLTEHLGSEPVVDAAGRPIAARYLAAAELLAALHARPWPRTVDLDGAAYRIPDYDRAALAIETELFLDWYVPFATGRAADEAMRATFARLWQALFERLESHERSLVLRDFHSPNLIWRGDRSGHDRLGLIDFQDAVIGPAAYDLAALALDARVTVPAALESAVLARYRAARGPGLDAAAHGEAYAIAAAQRNTKLLGIFVRLDRRDGKPAYLAHLPRIRAYLARALAHPALAALAAFYAEAGVLDPTTEDGA